MPKLAPAFVLIWMGFGSGVTTAWPGVRLAHFWLCHLFCDLEQDISTLSQAAHADYVLEVGS